MFGKDVRIGLNIIKLELLILAPWGLGSRQVTCPQGPAEPRAEKQPWLPGLKVKSLALKPKRVNAFILHSSGETIVTVM